MSRTPELGAALFNTEASWAEVSTTFGTRVQCIGTIDVSKLQQQKLTPAYTTQLLNEIGPGVNGVFGGEFEIPMMLTGHGSTCAGAVSVTALETLLGIFLGTSVQSSSSGTTATVGGTATALNVALASGYTPGAFVRCGSIGDGRGNGQLSIVTSHSASVINLAVAIDAALNNGDVVYNPFVSYTKEDPVASPAITSTRWRFQTGNLQYDCRGCYPKAIILDGLGPAGEPMVRFRLGSSFMLEQNNTFPNATSVQTFPHAAVSCGSLFMNTKGSATPRDATTKFDARSFSITWDLGIAERKGPGGLYANQVVINCSRTRSQGKVEFTVDAPDATATPALVTKWSSNTPQSLLYTWSAEDGKAGGVFLPYVVPDGDRPVQFDNGGIAGLKFMGRFGSDNTKSNDLERSAMRIASC